MEARSPWARTPEWPRQCGRGHHPAEVHTCHPQRCCSSRGGRVSLGCEGASYFTTTVHCPLSSLQRSFWGLCCTSIRCCASFDSSPSADLLAWPTRKSSECYKIILELNSKCRQFGLCTLWVESMLLVRTWQNWTFLCRGELKPITLVIHGHVCLLPGLLVNQVFFNELRGAEKYRQRCLGRWSCGWLLLTHCRNWRWRLPIEKVVGMERNMFEFRTRNLLLIVLLWITLTMLYMDSTNIKWKSRVWATLHTIIFHSLLVVALVHLVKVLRLFLLYILFTFTHS